MGSSTFSWTDKGIQQKLHTAVLKSHAYLSKTTVFYSLMAENTARTGARWTDRSGNARNKLAGTYEAALTGSGGTYTVNLSQGVTYGIYLETRNFSRAGDLSIVLPTINATAPKFMAAANKVFASIFGGGA